MPLQDWLCLRRAAHGRYYRPCGCREGRYSGRAEGKAMKAMRASYKQWAGVGVVLGVALTVYHLRSISPVSDWRIWLFELTAHSAILAAIGLAGAGVFNSVLRSRTSN